MVSGSKKRIGIFGGTFDPIHNGHFQNALLAKEHLSLDTLLFVPSANPPYRPNGTFASFEHRCNMIRAALKNHADCTLWEHFDHTNYRYTVDTVREIKNHFVDSLLYFIIGSDAVVDIPCWYRYREFLSMVNLCVIPRPGFSGSLPESLASTRVFITPSVDLAVSSTEIRCDLKKNVSCSSALPESVHEYIEQHKLYR